MGKTAGGYSYTGSLRDSQLKMNMLRKMGVVSGTDNKFYQSSLAKQQSNYRKQGVRAPFTNSLRSVTKTAKKYGLKKSK